MEGNNRKRFSIFYVFLAFWIVLIVHNLFVTGVVKTLPYSEFLAALEEGRVREATLTTNHVKGKLEVLPEGDDPAAEPEVRDFRAVRVEDRDLTARLEEAGVEFRGVVEDTFFTNLLSWVIPILLLGAIWYFIFMRLGKAQRGMLNLGKNRAKIYQESDTGVTFEDVAGVDEAKAELVEVVDFLTHSGRYASIGAKLPKGVLLVGPPGTGKTLLARAVAGESNVTFFSTSGSEFVEMFVGMGAARVRDMFEQAKKQSPCIIFIDELDALGKARGGPGGFGGGHDEREQTLNQLLAEMDGFDPRHAVVIMGATNRPESLDRALLRPGRFDRQILVDRPDKNGREAILRVHLKDVKHDPELKLEEIAAMTAGMVGADLANLVNEGALVAVRRGKQRVEKDDLQEAIERIVGGLEKKNRVITPDERRVVAFHEIGHAILGLTLAGADRVQKITIVPRGVAALGYTLNIPTEERFLMSKRELEGKIAMALGGRAAEEVCCSEISTGAHNDLQKATDIAFAMVTEYGMDENVGHPYLKPRGGSPFLGGDEWMGQRRHSERTARDVDLAVKRILDGQYRRAVEVLRDREDALRAGAELLLEKETITGADLAAILQQHNHRVGVE
ncbi:MAG: ATP-dependent zinc metalloprotease FtsH [Candidatus Krumholzibacteriia bacterium]